VGVAVGDHSANRGHDVWGLRLVAKAEVSGVELEACDLGDVAVLVVVALVPELTGVMPLRASRHDREKGSGCDSVPNG